jgi:hypothetical protein
MPLGNRHNEKANNGCKAENEFEHICQENRPNIQQFLRL